MATALITGITGQDGWYLAQSLLKRGDRVVGLTREIGAAARAFDGGHPRLTLRAFDYVQPGAIAAVIEDEAPDYIFNLASFATGQGMFDMPMDMVRLNGVFVLDILEALRNSPRSDEIAFVQASSSEMFGAVTEMPQNEATPLRPKSPYGAAKQFAHVMTGIYRNAFGVKASSAILYNHESVRRPAAFVTKKIARGAARIRAGLESELALGSLDIARDWGYAPDYVDAMYRMATAPIAEDFVVATGHLSTIRDVVTIAFERVGLDWEKFVKIDPRFVRPIETIGLCGDPSKIAQRLGWRATVGVETIVAEMVDHELAIAQNAA
jgi:GDPmannose 4,6-dehydratase